MQPFRTMFRLNDEIVTYFEFKKLHSLVLNLHCVCACVCVFQVKSSVIVELWSDWLHQLNQLLSVPFSQSIPLWILQQPFRYFLWLGINNKIEWLKTTNPIDPSSPRTTHSPFDWDLFRSPGLFSLAFLNLKWAKWRIETEAVGVSGPDCDHWPQSTSTLGLHLSLHTDSAFQW